MLQLPAAKNSLQLVICARFVADLHLSSVQFNCSMHL
uniref:Uncharacterized protein n=1 Tax=Arundo donax TaxID=35708 RepID=A0A0A9AAR2_ARUDO